MPVLKQIFDIENSLVKSRAIKINFDHYFDFSDFTYTVEEKKPDSIFFYDGSHLAHEYSYIFSGKLADILRNDSNLSVKEIDWQLFTYSLYHIQIIWM